MAYNNTGLSDQLLIDALEIAHNQRKRAADKFRPGSAARAEIEAEAGQISLAMNTIKSNLEPTPIEKAANRK